MSIGLRRLALLAPLLAAVACSDPSDPGEPAGPPRIVFQSNRDGNWEIYSMAADGSDQRNMTQHPEGDYMPAWSRDHRRIAFVSDRAPAGLWVMNADGSDPRPVGSGLYGRYPAWSPDGTRIAVTANLNGRDEIWTVRPDGTGLVQVTQGTWYTMKATWSPDGRRIAYTHGGQILVRNADGTGTSTPLTPYTFDNGASWSPVGPRIAFDRYESGVSSIWTIGADGTGLVRLTTPPENLFDSQPAWAPDATQLVFVRQEASPENSEIWVVNADGSGPRNLTSHPGSDARPSW